MKSRTMIVLIIAVAPLWFGCGDSDGLGSGGGEAPRLYSLGSLKTSDGEFTVGHRWSLSGTTFTYATDRWDMQCNPVPPFETQRIAISTSERERLFELLGDPQLEEGQTPQGEVNEKFSGVCPDVVPGLFLPDFTPTTPDGLIPYLPETQFTPGDSFFELERFFNDRFDQLDFETIGRPVFPSPSSME